jgi:alkylated DNA repair dioxygenase AlkB
MQEQQTPKGLRYIQNFVTPEEEQSLLAAIDACPWNKTISRRTQQYGFEYDYSRSSMPRACAPIPAWLHSLKEAIETTTRRSFDQVIINEYNPGEGIAPHVDHTGQFGDTVVSISLGSDCVMDFATPSQTLPFLLERRSAVILTDEARYKWTHGIAKRKTDRFPDGITLRRVRRVSLTFRKVK